MASRNTQPVPTVYLLRVECPVCQIVSSPVAIPYEHKAFHAVTQDFINQCPDHYDLTQARIDQISAEIKSAKRIPYVPVAEQPNPDRRPSATPRQRSTNTASNGRQITVLTPKNIFNSGYSKGYRAKPKVAPPELDADQAVTWFKGYVAGEKKAAEVAK